MIVATGRDERNGTGVRDAIGVAVNAFVQLRRNAHRQCPKKSRGDENRGESACPLLRTRPQSHGEASFCVPEKLRKKFLQHRQVS